MTFPFESLELCDLSSTQVLLRPRLGVRLETCLSGPHHQLFSGVVSCILELGDFGSLEAIWRFKNISGEGPPYFGEMEWVDGPHRCLNFSSASL